MYFATFLNNTNSSLYYSKDSESRMKYHRIFYPSFFYFEQCLVRRLKTGYARISHNDLAEKNRSTYLRFTIDIRFTVERTSIECRCERRRTIFGPNPTAKKLLIAPNNDKKVTEFLEDVNLPNELQRAKPGVKN